MNFKGASVTQNGIYVVLVSTLELFFTVSTILMSYQSLTDESCKGLDTTIAADVQASILVSLGEIEKLAWVGIGFPMGSVATILLIGASYGLFDIKYLLIAGVILFEAGSALCGASPNMNAIIVGRVIAGIGGAGMYLG
jgi:MFS family permease